MSLQLDLTNASEGGFDPLPNGTYQATIKKTEMRETGGAGKMPEGTQILNVGFEIDSDEIPEHPDAEKGKKYTTWVYKGYVIPPSDYEKADTLMGILLSMLKATSLWSEDELRSGEFELIPEDLHGARMRVKVSTREYTDQATDEKRSTNQVDSVKPIAQTADIT